MMKSGTSIPRPAVLLCLLGAVSCGPEEESTGSGLEYEQLTTEYIEAWKEFYPSSAVRLGLDLYLAQPEDRSPESVRAWVGLNGSVYDRIAAAPADLSLDLIIDLRLLENQVRSELTRWRDERPHLTSPGMYSAVFRDLVDVPETLKRMGGDELEPAVEKRLTAISGLSHALAAQLVSGSATETERSIRTLRGTLTSLEALADRFPNLREQVGPATEAVISSIGFLQDSIQTREEESAFPLGRERYSRELARYYDMEITPEEVADRALEEIELVRNLISETSTAYWREAHADEPIPTDVAELVARVSADMEENRPSTQQESLERFSQFAEEAELFVRERGIATLPPDRTLEIVLTPESAGPAQRIGFVDSAPPFDPDPMTVLSLPTIPDSFPEREKEDFYRSFNNHFNKFIIIHELFPGHYLQLKIASGNPRQIRTFFPYEPYVEGWATLVEKIALDAGWDDFNKLTYLAHLRKRLENANRAYTSVQVHCFGWTEEDVRGFSAERALLAPQFAESLFGRLERGPMQMTSYFMGKDMFMEILDAERVRLGDEFVVRDFADVVLQAGAVPMELLPPLLAQAKPAG